MLKSNNKIREWSIYIFLFLVVALAALVWYKLYLPSNPRSHLSIELPIRKGTSLRAIATELRKEHLIKSKFFFLAYTLLMGSNVTLKAGTYLLSPAMNTPQIIQKLNSGDTLKRNITILEGWTLEDIANYLEKEKLCSKSVFFSVTGYPPFYQLKNSQYSSVPLAFDFDFLKDKPRDVSLEGYLFPDTYSIDILPDETERERAIRIVRMMLSNFGKRLSPKLRQKINQQGRTIHQVVTMASLLEKEMKGYPQKQIAAGILWKRMKSGWPLQVDATLTYLTHRKSLSLFRKDKKIDSPYNTYAHYGLPPGPICNPGLESILAAVYYKNSPNWYYLTTPEGKVIFSRTLQEHNAARFRYLK